MKEGRDKPAKPGESAAEGLGKRNNRRHRKRLMLRFGEGKAEKTGFTRNISATGLFIHTNSVVKPGTTIQVQIHFPDRVVSHWARVAWAKQAPPQLAHVVECGMGVRFIDPKEDWFEYFDQWRKKTGIE